MTLIAIVVSVLAVGSIGIYAINSEGDRNADLEMRLVCDSERKSLNEYLYSIEQSVNMVSRYATQDLNVVNLVSGGVAGGTENASEAKAASDRGQPLNMDVDSQQRRLDIYLDAHTRRVETVFASVANHTNGVVNYYYRLNPELSDAQSGFWYTAMGGANFEPAELVDIEAYDPSDLGHVGWYTIPEQRGRPSWLDPYHNDTLNIDIVSYISPIYKAGSLIGVIGMDIDRETLVEQLRDIVIYQTGYACLSDSENRLVYHPTLAVGTSFEDLNIQGIDTTNDGLSDDDIELFGFTYGGVKKTGARAVLSNGLSLLIVAPDAEINASWHVTVNVMIVATLVILLIFAIVATVVMKHITDPIQRLAAASRKLAEGNYDMKLEEYHENDEVGVLTRSFQQMADHLNSYIRDLNSKAYKDALTGVRNKGAFDIFSRKLDDQIAHAHEEGMPEFAVVMMDCNKLKEINDVYGHDKGDAYLLTACRTICGVFAHSPVFRLGGDEFVAILQASDYTQREQLLKVFDERAREINRFASHPWEHMSMAKGIAIFDPAIDSGTESVLHRADESMYDNKKHMKRAG